MGARVSIGDFAVMTSLSRKALRHYHEIGILEPAHIDSHTGYRFYDTGQVDSAHIIRRFRSLGMSIPDIKALLSTEDAAARTEIITTHLKQMEEQLQQTRDAVGATVGRRRSRPTRPTPPRSRRHRPSSTHRRRPGPYPPRPPNATGTRSCRSFSDLWARVSSESDSAWPG